MKIQRAFKYRLVPTEAQTGALERTVGCVRFVRNNALALQKHRLDHGARILSYADVCAELKSAKQPCIVVKP